MILRKIEKFSKSGKMNDFDLKKSKNRKKEKVSGFCRKVYE